MSLLMDWARAAKQIPLGFGALELWLDATKIYGLSDGATIGTWKDNSGKGKDFTQASEALKPAYKTNVFGVLPAVLFDGDYLQGSIGAIAQPATVISLIKKGTLQSADENLYRDNASAAAVGYVINSGKYWNLYAGAVLSSAVALSAGNKHILQEVYNGANSICGVGGTLVTGAGGSLGIGSPLNIGAGGSGVSLFYGHIAELLIYSRALSTTELAAMRSYLTSKWGI